MAGAVESAEIIQLREEEDFYIAASQLSPSAALILHNSKKFEVDFPSPANANCYRLRSKGWVGTMPLPARKYIRISPKVSVRNAFSMLETAYNLKPLQLFEGQTEVESIEEAFEVLAAILTERILERIRKGLYGSYVSFSEHATTLRGRVHISETLKLFNRTALMHCEFQEFTRDVEENRILLWTLNFLPRLDLKRPRTRNAVRQARNALLHSVTLEPKGASDCVGRSYNRLNEDYRELHGICRFFLENGGPGLSSGENQFLPFLLNMPVLFETFVASWLSANLPFGFKAIAQYHAKLAADSDLNFRIDIVLEEKGRPLAVLDTKYKMHHSPSAEDIQAVVSYAVRMGTRKAFLIYPFVLNCPTRIRVGNITVESVGFDLSGTLDLGGQKFLHEVLAGCSESSLDEADLR